MATVEMQEASFNNIIEENNLVIIDFCTASSTCASISKRYARYWDKNRLNSADVVGSIHSDSGKDVTVVVFEVGTIPRFGIIFAGGIVDRVL